MEGGMRGVLVCCPMCRAVRFALFSHSPEHPTTTLTQSSTLTQQLTINDIVRGKVTWNTDSLGDFVVLRR